MTLRDTLRNYHKISLDIEQAITEEDEPRIQELDTQYEALSETILNWRANGGEENRLLIKFLLDCLSEPNNRTPLEKRIVNRLTDLVDFGLMGSTKC